MIHIYIYILMIYSSIFMLYYFIIYIYDIYLVYLHLFGCLCLWCCRDTVTVETLVIRGFEVPLVIGKPWENHGKMVVEWDLMGFTLW